MSELADELVDAPDVDAPTDDGALGEPVARADELAAPPSAPQFDLNDPAVQAQLAGLSQQQTLGLLEQLGLVSYQDDTPAPPDPLSDNYVAEQQAYLDAVLAKQLAPIQEFVAQQQTQQKVSFVNSVIDQAVGAAKLENPPEGVVIAALADGFMQAVPPNQRSSPQAIQNAISQAVGLIASERKAAGDAAVVNYRKQIGEIADTPAEPSAGGTGGIVIEGKPRTYDEIVAAHAARFQAGRPEGLFPGSSPGAGHPSMHHVVGLPRGHSIATER